MRERYLYLIMLAIGGLLSADTIALLIKTESRNFGIFMPIIIGVPLIVAAIIMLEAPLFFSTVIGTVIKWLMITGYSAFAVLLCVTTLLTFSVGHLTPPNDADVLIVLGCGVKGKRVTLTLSRRLDRAIEYLNANVGAHVIVSGGQGPGEDITEALAMHDYLVAHGIDEARITQETDSYSTKENFENSKKIIDELYPHGAKVCYVTTYFHVFRSKKTAEKCGLNAEGFGAKGVWYITPNDYLRECATITVYFLTGKL